MNIVAALIGAVMGGMIGELSGAVFGAALGWLAAAHWSTGQVITTLRTEVDELRRRLNALGSSTTSTTQATPTQTASTPASTSISTSGATSNAAVDTPVTQPEPRPVPQPHQPQQTSAHSNSGASSGPRRIVPTEPDVFDRAFTWIKEWFTGGNTLVRVGAVILFFGVSFLLKYAAEHSHVPIEARISAVALGAIALLVVGWRLRSKRNAYALALQGTAVGMLYLVIFAAFRLYGLLPPTLAFGLLIVVCALAAALAVMQNAMWFALLGAGGGFLAPIAVSTGQGSHVALFSYYLLLNLGILAVAWFKAWRPLNLLGFVATFAIGTAWGALRYDRALFSSTEPFLIAFFVLFVAIAVLHSVRQPPQLRGYVDGSLVFGNPLIAFGLQVGLLRPDRYALAVSAVVVAALYLGLASVITRSAKAGLHTLAQAFWALGVVFVTLAVPLALDGNWTSATWSLEGVAIVWLGLKQQRRLARAFGVLLQVAAAAALWSQLMRSLFWNSHSVALNGVLLAAAAVLTSALLLRQREQLAGYERAAAVGLFFWGLIWWLITWVIELPRHLPDNLELRALLLLVVVTGLLCSLLARWMAATAPLRFVQLTALCALPLIACFVLVDWVAVTHPTIHLGWLVWPLSLALAYVVLRRDEAQCATEVADWLHAGLLWIILILLGWQISWLMLATLSAGMAWQRAVLVVLPLVALWQLPGLGKRIAWPCGAHRHGYEFIASTGVVMFLLWWSIRVLPDAGNAAPLPYVPLLNPLDLAQAAVWLGLVSWWNNKQEGIEHWRDILADTRQVVWVAAGGLVFLWLNAMLLRTLHHWNGIPMHAGIMWSSTLVQSSLSIFWAVLSLVAMVLATRWSRRLLWLLGAGLMAVVVVKLLLIDLSRIGTVARIVSFMGVGGLMLLIGYLAPLPPAQDTPATSKES